jgi:hypothetical protein
MHTLTLNNEEQALLVELLENRRKELAVEIHRTDSLDYRKMLEGKQSLLEAISAKLRTS